MADSDLIGTRLSHYRLLEVVGSGGMGVVYRAHDEHLDRDVAVKILPDEILADPAARRRFRREALTLSRLNHPHINTVHDFDTQDGLEFLVVEFVSGETLSDRIGRGPLPVAEALHYAVQVARGLAAAHEHHVVHRDLKPSNIMVTARGDAKVLDFGLARQMGSTHDMPHTPLASVTLTEKGVLTGTVPYMAPEQLLGVSVDARSDLWAVGAILYEMLTGRRPFDETSSVALINAILNQPVPLPKEARAMIPAVLQPVILKCLEKDPSRRYGSAAELIVDLDRVIAGARPVARLPWNPRIAVALLVALVVVITAVLLAKNPPWIRPALFQSLAVLPLQNLSGDPAQEYLADGMTEELIVAFSRIRGMRVVARGSVMHFKGSRDPISDIAKALNVEAVLEGSIRRTGNRARVTIALVRASTGQNVWADRYDRAIEDLDQVQGNIAAAVIREARVAVNAQERSGLSKKRNVKPEAYEAYLRGRYYWNQFTPEGFRKAVDQFNHAIEIQPDYALAFAGLADAYAGLSTLVLPPKEAMPRVRAAAERALGFDPELSDGYSSMGNVKAFYDWDWKGAEGDFKRAIELAPGNAQAWLNYGYMLVVLGRFNEASEKLARAHELDPLSSFVGSVQLWPLYESRRYDEAIEAARQKIATDSSSWNAYQVMSQALFQKHEYEQSYYAMAKAFAIRRADTTNVFANHYNAVGHPEVARRQLESFLKNHPLDYNIAMTYAHLGDRNRAFQILERDVESRNEGIIFLKVDPFADPLRSDPRYTALLRRMNLVD